MAEGAKTPQMGQEQAKISQTIAADRAGVRRTGTGTQPPRAGDAATAEARGGDQQMTGMVPPVFTDWAAI